MRLIVYEVPALLSCCRLLEQVLQRFEKEGGGHLLVATLCLLEVATRGLLESELLEILADEDNLMPPKHDASSEKGAVN